jgi:hypothetical protein
MTPCSLVARVLISNACVVRVEMVIGTIHPSSNDNHLQDYAASQNYNIDLPPREDAEFISYSTHPLPP